MSNAFAQNWIRTSASKQLLTILTYLAKKGDIHISLAELEQIEVGEGVVQSIVGGDLILRHAPQATRTFFIDSGSNASERRPSCPTNQSESLTPQRLAELLEPALDGPLSTLDDVAMAAREAQLQHRSQVVEQARVMRGQPLPVQQPTHPPTK